MKNHRNLGFIISLLHYAALAVVQAMATETAGITCLSRKMRTPLFLLGHPATSTKVAYPPT
jgi:hypothetical protein